MVAAPAVTRPGPGIRTSSSGCGFTQSWARLYGTYLAGGVRGRTGGWRPSGTNISGAPAVPTRHGPGRPAPQEAVVLIDSARPFEGRAKEFDSPKARCFRVSSWGAPAVAVGPGPGRQRRGARACRSTRRDLWRTGAEAPGLLLVKWNEHGGQRHPVLQSQARWLERLCRSGPAAARGRAASSTSRWHSMGSGLDARSPASINCYIRTQRRRVRVGG